MRERERVREQRVRMSASASCSDLRATAPSPQTVLSPPRQAAGAVVASPDSVGQLRKRLSRSNGAGTRRPACPSSRSMPSLPQQKLPLPPPFDSAAARKVHANGCSAGSEAGPLALGTARNGPLEARSESEMSLESHASL